MSISSLKKCLIFFKQFLKKTNQCTKYLKVWTPLDFSKLKLQYSEKKIEKHDNFSQEKIMVPY